MEHLTFDEIADFNIKKEALLHENTTYMRAHEELRHLIDDFFTSVLLRKPRNLHKYAADYFSELLKQQRGIILCGPNGAGKHSIVKKILSEFPKAFQVAPKHTTKVPNSTDQNLIFISTDKMSEMNEEGKFLRVEDDREGNRYGIAKQTYDNITKEGKICLLETDVKGSKEYNNCKKFEQKPFYIFIKPPSPEVLEQRLQKRGESEEIIQKTMNELKADLDFADNGFYDLILVNDNLESTYNDLKNQLYKWYKHLLAVRKTYNLPL